MKCVPFSFEWLFRHRRHSSLEKCISKVGNEAAFLCSILFDDQSAAADTGCRVQAVLLLLRYSLAAKLVYFGQTIDPAVLEPFAHRFDDIIRRTFLKELDIAHVFEDQKLQIPLSLNELCFPV